jgi:hypothetical protein
MSRYPCLEVERNAAHCHFEVSFKDTRYAFELSYHYLDRYTNPKP